MVNTYVGISKESNQNSQFLPSFIHTNMTYPEVKETPTEKKSKWALKKKAVSKTAQDRGQKK